MVPTTSAAEPRPPIHDVAAMLADEGVPVRAIARAIKIPGEEVYDILKTAIDEGRLIELPRDDWPPGLRNNRSQSEKKILGLEDGVLIIACANRFKMTKLQAVVFLTLLRRHEVTKAQLHNAIEQNRPENSDPTDQKMVDVVICHIRRKLKPDNVDIKTIWGVGYSIGQHHRTHLINIIADHLSGAKNAVPQA